MDLKESIILQYFVRNVIHGEKNLQYQMKTLTVINTFYEKKMFIFTLNHDVNA